MTAAPEIVELTGDFYQDPHAIYRSLRTRGPIHRVRVEGVLCWLVVDYEVAKQAFVEPNISKKVSSPEGQAILAKNGAADMFNSTISDNMLFADPPQHTRLRSLVAKAFASRAVRDLGPRITTIADTLLDEMTIRERVDLLDSYAFPLPIAVICELLGVPDDEKDAFRSWTAVVVNDSATIEARTSAGVSFFTYLTELIAKRTDDPRDDLLSELIIAKDDDDRLDQQELISMLFLLLAAGHETTVNLIGNAVLELLRDPQRAGRLRADPTGIPAYIDEILRCQGPVHLATARYTTAPITLGNQDIDAGEFIMISLAAANRDPERFAEPDRIDADRDDNRHIAFGHGIHYCIGAALARTEATIALTRLLAKVPVMSLDTAAGEPTWRKSLLIRGLAALPVRLAPPVDFTALTIGYEGRQPSMA
ncbi:cytochrome P450 [Nocardia sp. NBC_00565]|uniref:cytochrome P450 family protein n=1 Tax=Nocardia sp. NBC_00565 TaxID=2975993 RepID=UPI002E7FD5F3|nr:cytochrome P450 [Nocardia sp. NBC_00565]WUC02146.1 cytochrome P450 [Nocardia sp. NBC_00565]